MFKETLFAIRDIHPRLPVALCVSCVRLAASSSVIKIVSYKIFSVKVKINQERYFQVNPIQTHYTLSKSYESMCTSYFLSWSSVQPNYHLIPK